MSWNYHFTLIFRTAAAFDLARSCFHRKTSFEKKSFTCGVILHDLQMGNKKCVICSNSGPRGYFTFPSLKLKPFLLQKWLESLAIDQVPKKPSERVCFRHFPVDQIHFTDDSTYPAPGKHSNNCFCRGDQFILTRNILC